MNPQNKKNYFELLKPLVLNYMICFQTDFTEHDRTELENYNGDFILALRTTGTNLLKLSNTQENKKKISKKMIDLWIIGKIPPAYERNKRFFFGSKGTIREISKEQVYTIIEKYNNAKIYA